MTGQLSRVELREQLQQLVRHQQFLDKALEFIAPDRTTFLDGLERLGDVYWTDSGPGWVNSSFEYHETGQEIVAVHDNHTYDSQFDPFWCVQRFTESHGWEAAQ